MATIVEAVKNSIANDQDHHWTVEFSRLNGWKRDEFMRNIASAAEVSVIKDINLIEMINNTSATLWADWR